MAPTAVPGGAPRSFFVSLFVLAACLLTAVAAGLARETDRRDLTADTA